MMEWQTWTPQKRLLERACGFESRSRHTHRYFVVPTWQCAGVRPESDREAIYALVAGGMSRRRAAEMLGIPCGTVAHWFDPVREAKRAARARHELCPDCVTCRDGLS